MAGVTTGRVSALWLGQQIRISELERQNLVYLVMGVRLEGKVKVV